MPGILCKHPPYRRRCLGGLAQYTKADTKITVGINLGWIECCCALLQLDIWFCQSERLSCRTAQKQHRGVIRAMHQKSLAVIRRRLEILGFESVDDTPVGLEHLIVGNIIHRVPFLITHNHPSTLFPGLGDDGLTRYKSKHGPDQYNRRRRLGHCIGHGG